MEKVKEKMKDFENETNNFMDLVEDDEEDKHRKSPNFIVDEQSGPQTTDSVPLRPPRRKNKESLKKKTKNPLEAMRDLCITNMTTDKLYTDLDYINEGASGTVWKAKRKADGQHVALKVMFDKILVAVFGLL